MNPSKIQSLRLRIRGQRLAEESNRYDIKFLKMFRWWLTDEGVDKKMMETMLTRLKIRLVELRRMRKNALRDGRFTEKLFTLLEADH